ncbi:hypothetical protein OIU84_020201 [Salix udensis]|uniref:Rhamnogalacturonase A/B/Epimerase-like pectate lyase domain-containing protein n=1 Tax=Salix udensis TaxID=889485 RepID=A0AAD6PJZ6_9ROSI|nr:hypothetical protein OIU84_020201 [Salix udensis]
MARTSSSRVLLPLLVMVFTSYLATAAQYNVLSYGAKPDGITDSTNAFLAAWAQACSSVSPSTIYAPPGRFYLRNVAFKGPCKNNAIVVRIDGTLQAPTDYRVIGSAGNWVFFQNVDGCYGFCIGSLGKDLNEPGVKNVTVKTVTFIGTQNGLRIKSWGRPSSGFVNNVLFQHAAMTNVQNPIVIDQNYCPGSINCPGQASGVEISDVIYQDIKGNISNTDCSEI